MLWFKGKELNMVFGVQLSLVRLGSAMNFWVMEPIYNWVQQFYQGYQGIGVVLFIGIFYSSIYIITIHHIICSRFDLSLINGLLITNGYSGPKS